MVASRHTGQNVILDIYKEQMSIDIYKEQMSIDICKQQMSIDICKEQMSITRDLPGRPEGQLSKMPNLLGRLGPRRASRCFRHLAGANV